MKGKIWYVPFSLYHVDDQDFRYDPALYEFTERDECPAGEVCTVEGDVGVLAENKLPWEEDLED